MKYTIELTDKQRKRFKHMNKALIKMGMGFDILSLLEPIKTTNVEDTSEYQIGYKVGFEDGKKQAIEEIPELANKENEIYNDGYNKGYNSAINDYNAMYEWLHDCFVDFKEFLLEKGFYTDEKFLDGFVVGQLMYDLICDHDIAEVISEFKKWQEEKKKAEEESIKVGDVIYSEMTDSKAIIISFDAWDNWNCIDTCGTGFTIDNSKMEFWKKIGHIDEVSQLLDKLRGETDEKN